MVSETSTTGKKIFVGFIITILVLFMMGVAFGGTYAYLLLNEKTIVKNVYVNGINIGGLSKENAILKLKEHYEPLTQRDLILQWDSGEKKVVYSQVGVSYDYEKVVDKAYAIGKDKNVIKSLKDIYNANKKGVRLSLNMEIDDRKIDDILGVIAKEVDMPSEDARLLFNNGVFTVIPDKKGKKLDLAASKDLILAAIKNGAGSVKLKVQEVMPKYTTDFFKRVNTKVSSFSTQFNPADANRTDNIKTAAKALNGKLLMPGEEFSLNKTLGPRVISNGYKTAPVIVNGKLVDDVGGGVCQIATTLYNAVLRANLDVTRRIHHQFPVAYVPPGQDATIAGDWFDFRFKNTSKYPIYISSYVSGNRFNVDLYGDNYMNGITLDFKSDIVKVNKAKTIYVDDDKLPYGKEEVERPPHDGMVVEVYRYVYKNGRLIKKEKLYTDTYETVDAIIRRGTNKELLQDKDKNISPSQSNRANVMDATQDDAKINAPSANAIEPVAPEH
ncbi:Vancomycin resistance protein YoaR, contains peptidoglycan-binding and VanW domains [Caldanaerobius fijiensis DSM 17918]|uniref:Vancomycin resistance protein YoaR, contains peptidoglycan-binding and VanW domains n=2 Tax=Caldanaerobius TaxID=862261 RepID=A0A1M4YQQ3_9THEO|nr:Vancomycin resistance protein YoaR, contains peptidoglycan-binding and VanW domains [Caldanaerobius fijiensis DSM 17918]